MRPRSRNRFVKLFQLAGQNLHRNLLLSVATSVMMGLILFIFNVILALNVLTQASLADLQDKVDLVVYVSNEATFFEVSELIGDLEEREEVMQVNYTSPSEALEDFLQIYPSKEDPFSKFELENPLPGSLQIITENPKQHGTVTQWLRSSSFGNYILSVESGDENQAVLARLLRVTNFTEKLIIGVTVTFIFGSILMIMNAIHLSIFTRKREIQIMQLVGAKPNMIRMPFMIEGAIYGLIAVLFSFALLVLFLEGTQLSSLSLFQESFNGLNIFGIEVLVSMGVGILSSWIASNFYLKKSLVLEA